MAKNPIQEEIYKISISLPSLIGDYFKTLFVVLVSQNLPARISKFIISTKLQDRGHYSFFFEVYVTKVKQHESVRSKMKHLRMFFTFFKNLSFFFVSSRLPKDNRTVCA